MVIHQKKIKSEFGEIDIQVPRDRKGEFQPKIIPKYQRNVSGIEEKVIALYARGMSTRDISQTMKNFMDSACLRRWLARLLTELLQK